jgi:hypothetical protein
MILKDPSPAPESSQLRAKNLKNKPLLVRPGEEGEQQGKDGNPWRYIVCEVVALDRSGIVERGDGVRFSWARALPQLIDGRDIWIACRPVEDGNAVILEPLDGAERDVAERVLDELGDDG